jgi:hypothetical protein
VEFSGVYEYKSPQGPSANIGEGIGFSRIDGDTAMFKPEGAKEECQITLNLPAANWSSRKPVFADSATM